MMASVQKMGGCPGAKFARVVFLAAGIWGLLLFIPMYFAELFVSGSESPAQTHPELYYGFVGVGLAWQVAFLLIARDPARFRPLIPATLIEKFSFGLAALVLGACGRVPAMMVGFGVVDLLLGVLFAVSYQML